MNEQKVLMLLDELLEVAPGTLKGNESVAEWGSIAIIGLIALADEQFGKSLSTTKIHELATVDNVVKFLMANT